MKKFVLLSAFALTIIGAKAQVTFGVTGGITSASYKQKEGNVTITSDSRIGFTLGGFANISVSDNISIQPGLNFTQKGGNYSDGGGTANATLNYLEIPINATYNIEAGPGKVIVGAGPTISYGLSGKVKTTFAGQSETTDIKFGTDEIKDDLKPLELGLNLIAGYKLSNGLSFALNYNLGSNIALGNDVKSNNRYFGIRLGYEFGGE
jgi:hypothetical protein